MRNIPKEVDLGKDPVGRLLFTLAVPTITSQVVNALYNIVDRMYIGHIPGEGAAALTGLGVCFPLIMLISAFANLIGMGGAPRASILMGHGDEKGAERILGSCFAALVALSVVLTAFSFVFMRPMLMLFGASDATIGYAMDYMEIYAAGTIFVQLTLGMNVFITAQGFSKISMMTVVIGAVTNIVLDILLVGFTDLGVAGAAIATVISQVVSVVMVLYVLRKKTDCTKLYFRRIRFTRSILRNMLLIGFPAGIQSIMYTISNLIIQSAINGFGTDTAAAWAAYSKVDQIFWMFINAFGIAITTFVGQNYGAGKIDRAKKGVRTVLLMGAVSTFVIEAGYFAVGEFGLMLFTTDSEVLSIGVSMMRYIVPWYITYIAIELLSGAIRGAGKSLIPTLISVVGICVLRMIWIFVVPYINPTILRVLASYPFSWIVTSVLFIVYYFKGDIYNEKRKPRIA